MKKYFVLTLVLFSAIAIAKPIHRTYDKDANGKFEVDCYELVDQVIISCKASEICNECPRTTASLECTQMLAYDGTDELAMDQLFTYADAQCASGVLSGQHTLTYQVQNEPQPRQYKVSWNYNSSLGQFEQVWERVS